MVQLYIHEYSSYKTWIIHEYSRIIHYSWSRKQGGSKQTFMKANKEHVQTKWEESKLGSKQKWEVQSVLRQNVK